MEAKNALLVSAALMAVVAGCGGGDSKTLSKAQVIARGTTVCKAAERKAEKLPSPTSEHPFAKGTSAAERARARRFIAGYADALESSRVGLQALHAPKQDRRLLDGYLRDTGQVVAKLRVAAKAPPARVEPTANQAFALFEKASRQTAAYGFPKGVCGAGAS